MGKFIAFYSSREIKCSHIFSSTALNDDVVVPRTIIRLCGTCGKNHTFFRTSMLLVSTPSQMKRSYTYGKNIGVIESDVVLDL